MDGKSSADVVSTVFYVSIKEKLFHYNYGYRFITQP